MISQGPFDLTLGTALPLNDPGANSNNPATAVQIQNASPFIIDVNAGGIALTIQSFTAQTVPTSGGGQEMSVTPIQTNQPGQTTATKVLTVVWLLAGESAPMVDGPLTAAAIVNAFGNSIITTESGGGSALAGTSVGPSSTVALLAAPAAGKVWRIQNISAAGPGAPPVTLQLRNGSTVVALVPINDCRYLGGQVINDSVHVFNDDTTNSNFFWMTYDEITQITVM